MRKAYVFHARLDADLLAVIDHYVDTAPYLWETRSQFIRSAVFWFVKFKATDLLREGKGRLGLELDSASTTQGAGPQPL